MNLSSAWEMYLVDKKLEGYSVSTLKSYRIQSSLLIRSIGDIDLSEVTLELVKSYLIEFCSHLKPSSLGHRIKFIRSMFTWAINEGYVAKNPVAKLREPKDAKRIPKALSEESLEMLREGCKTVREHALVEVFFASGCRIGEIFQLNRSAINWDDRSMIVFGKGAKERECYFTVKAAIWLKKYLNSRNDSDTALFVTHRAPHRLSIAMMRTEIKKIAKNAEIEENVYPHKLRHTYATHLINNGGAIGCSAGVFGTCQDRHNAFVLSAFR